MKTVFTSHEIPHLWAHPGTVPHGRNANGSLSFQGAILRSYQTDIGMVLEVGKAVLLNLESYSNTTSKQQHAMRVACSHYPQQFEVRDLGRGDGLRRMTPVEIVENITAQAVEWQNKASKARTTGNKPHYTRMAVDCVASANAALTYFKIKRKAIILEGLAEAAARTHLRKEKARSKRILAMQAEQARLEAEALTAWKEGARMGHHRFYGSPVALRLVVEEDGRLVVQTSLGAEVLLVQALRLFKLCSCVKAGRLAPRDEHGCLLYTSDAADE